MHFTLASASPRRKELLVLVGLPFETTNADIDERVLSDEAPEDYARRLSREKAQAASKYINGNQLILAADTIVVDGYDVLGKPRNAEEAAAILRRLRGRTHQVYTAITLLDTATAQGITDLAGSPVQMRNYSDTEIAEYIAGGDPFDKAGAYAIQHTGFHPVENFGHCMANVIGLPLCHVTRSLREMDIDPPNDVPSACQAHIGYRCPVYARILAREE
ncbi:MAG: septum formation protein Maf [Anaerolineae bacterium]|nr:septum formation protein Maf [Anaerolineae bacterium]